MNTRLRFKFVPESNKTVLQGPEILAGNDMLVPFIDVTTLELFFKGTDGKLVETFKGESVPGLKSMAKTMLKARGALFNAEVRNGKLSRDTTSSLTSEEEQQVVLTMDHDVA